LTQDNAIIRIANALTSASIDEFDDRLKLQKIAYLAQELGADSGFTFSWHIRGPYSPSLTRVLYSADELDALRIQHPQLDQSEKKIVNSLKELIGDDFDDPRKLELYASVWYCIPRLPLTKEDKRKVSGALRDLKPQFSERELTNALERIVAFRTKFGR
jgi:hypothetical protein